MIKEFNKEYGFLSNFYTCKIVYTFNDLPFYTHYARNSRYTIQVLSSEHLFQACKSYHFTDHYQIASCKTPGYAKNLGRKVKLRNDWDVIKNDVMRYCLGLKFDQNEFLFQKLIETHPKELQEGNRWRDTYWGIDLKTGKGLNMLGKLLMELRNEYLFGINTEFEDVNKVWMEMIKDL